jgi:hypothetical protein
LPDEPIKVTVNGERFRKAMREQPGLLYARLRETFRLHHQSFLNRFKRENLRAGKSGEGVQSRSRRLSRSFADEIRGDNLDSLEVETFSSGVKYARIQEYGGEIKPVRGQYLTIPLDAARAGDREGAISRASARHFENTFFLKTAGGKLLLMQRQGGNVVPLFLLVKSVMLQPRLGFRKLWDRMEPDFIRKIDAAVDGVLAAGAA